MLLPSAISCESSSTPSSTPKRTRYQQTALFASPPLSPTPSTPSHPTITNLYSTCRALQSMLTTTTTPSQLPSPPTTHAEPASPFKLRLRARGAAAPAPRKITKRERPPARGPNKRRRAATDEIHRETQDDGDHDHDHEPDHDEETPVSPNPSTPKRARLAPETLPLGLERADFQPEKKTEEEDPWSTEEDRVLVELVLEKLKLTKSDWQDCARSLGKDRGSVGRRWKSLIGAGEVGLKGRQRRGKIHGTWR